ncbi:Molybdenum ABC transporter permease protein ModB [hydrothermal vent metagenome]|uniref:Molybdenum ABC transporter permease protein ModB n=1 Tax=hydrothermal vent metagenome TaxID=652676 RepID=A0A3B0XIV3_9ZZZZ
MIDLAPIWVTLKLASLTTIILLIIGTPLAWWLANTHNKFKVIIESIVALPLVLPPTVLGFYLLIALSPNGFIGSLWSYVSDSSLTFSFSGLVIGSVIYSMPFVVQPLQASFEMVGKPLQQAAYTLGASSFDTFKYVVFPLSRRGFLVAITLGFAHTVGEFGVVLMIGGNIPKVTQVLSMVIYDHVEVLEYTQAHTYSIGLIVFSFIVLFMTYSLNKKLMVRM